MYTTVGWRGVCAGGVNSANAVQGVLLGLLEGDTLEITNCFSFPADEDADVHDYQREMIKKLRKINIDQVMTSQPHHSTGW